MTRYLEVAKAVIKEHQPYKLSEVPGILQVIYNRIPDYVDVKGHVPLADLVKWNVGYPSPVGF